jgi:hypothetical protein
VVSIQLVVADSTDLITLFSHGLSGNHDATPAIFEEQVRLCCL